MPLSRFLHRSLDSVAKRSKQYEQDKTFIDTPTIGLRQWTDRYYWAKSNKIETSKILQNSVEYYCPAGEETRVTEDQIKNVL
jgi:hypothetical protein